MDKAFPTVFARLAITVAWIVLGFTGAARAQDVAPGKQDVAAGKLLGVLLAAGDIAWCDQDTHKATAAVLAAQMKDATSRGVPVLVLVLGDLAYPAGKKKELDCFHGSWGEAVKQAPLLPAPGND